MGETLASLDQDLVLSLKEEYSKVRKLLDIDRQANESQPFQNKYDASDILKNMCSSLQNSLDNSKQYTSHVMSMLGIIYLDLGIISIETEELKSGEEYLMKCIETLNKTENVFQAETILPLISVLNQLGILWSNRDQPAKARVFLERAESTYKEYKENKNLDPISMSEIFDIKDKEEISAKETVEKLYTLTLYYLAQIHGTMENYILSATYCHATLSRQLVHKVFDSVDWALNAATLSQFFMEKGGFTQAKHHLGAAMYILQKYKDTLEKNDDKDSDEVMAAKWENFKHRRADVARCWAKYGILLLSSSRERLMEKAGDEQDELSSETARVDLNSESKKLQDCLNNLKFSTIENDIENVCKDITDKYLLDINDAVPVFLQVKKWLEEAKEFYCLENHASDYVQVVQDFSQAYKYLAFFEEDDGRRAKMHKRRITILESVANELNPQYYLGACREIWLELVETYSEIRAIKFDRIRAMEQKPSANMLAKLNTLTTQAIKNVQLFLDSLKEFENSEGTKKFPEEMTRVALSAYFQLGRLSSLFVNQERDVQLVNTKKSLEAYTFLVNYCEKDSKARDLMIEELSVCKQLVNLLPLKISKLMKVDTS